ncbi:MAG: helix-turn-helix domain-containing protein [Kangiella sp.]|jgi:transcriptional regulator with XRE-family HTH domain|nr:helix-turn-helix domain-containing protein [Kangiella sp.]MCW9029459.1 helix-turn-helix domain-containing protein [Kangiella sp.]
MIVRKLRLRNGWSQEQLAELMGVSTRTIQRIERGQTKPSLETQKSLAAVFEVDIATFEPSISMDSTGEPDMNTTNTNETTQQAEQGAKPKPAVETVSNEEADAMEYVKGIKEFYSHLLIYIIFSVIFIFAGKMPDMLIAWGAWTLGLVFHGLQAFEVINIFKINWEKKMVEKRLKKKL